MVPAAAAAMANKCQVAPMPAPTEGWHTAATPPNQHQRTEGKQSAAMNRSRGCSIKQGSPGKCSRCISSSQDSTME